MSMDSGTIGKLIQDRGKLEKKTGFFIELLESGYKESRMKKGNWKLK